jgi:phosphatidylethanolamine/phosphatidyl-N-methylethanolamine N-methyltransferase
MSSPEGAEAAAPASAGRRKSPFRFIEAFIREPMTVGAFWPSSSRLSRLIVDSCEFKPDETVVELGPGTGAFTELLMKRVNKRGRLMAIEVSDTNIKVLRERFPRCHTVHDSAQNLPQHLEGKKANCIVSGLAWGNMLPATQDKIFEAIQKSLAPHGQFVAFAYVHAYWFPTSARFRRRIFKDFAHIETTPIVWRNLPPAFVFKCWRS